MSNPIDDLNDALDNLENGMTPMVQSQIDEQEIDNLLVEEGIHEDHYPTIRDIANPDAINDIDDIN